MIEIIIYPNPELQIQLEQMISFHILWNKGIIRSQIVREFRERILIHLKKYEDISLSEIDILVDHCGYWDSIKILTKEMCDTRLVRECLITSKDENGEWVDIPKFFIENYAMQWAGCTCDHYNRLIRGAPKRNSAQSTYGGTWRRLKRFAYFPVKHGEWRLYQEGDEHCKDNLNEDLYMYFKPVFR